ncbi:hypothetical protein [Mycobacterium bourgelatii]|uniref:hypothetical protein n=1 Tax=Mycobacterium bourgelatii TaxID=1273442 RepID=UPI0013D80A65|nr:hypothetical protein [Mycobacterium bourgelatii]MCV6973937.1 hypothetical protein [Mycobacterium bourgelatii]
MAKSSNSTVIDLQSHPKWIAAHRHDWQRLEAMRRHPSYLGRQRAAARIGGRRPSADTPA